MAQYGHNRPVSLSQPRSFERQLHSENCRMSYFWTSANAAVDHQVAANGSNLVVNGRSPASWSLRLLRRMGYSRTRP